MSNILTLPVKILVRFSNRYIVIPVTLFSVQLLTNFFLQVTNDYYTGEGKCRKVKNSSQTITTYTVLQYFGV